MARYIVVLPTYAVGPFESEVDAKEYVSAMFGHLDSEYDDLTWSIKPLQDP